MAVAGVFHSTLSVRRHLFVGGFSTCDEQTATLVVERFPCWPCNYVARSIFCASSLRNNRTSFLACWFYVNERWGRTKSRLWNTFVPPLTSYFLELTTSVQRAALRGAWGALSLGDRLTSSLTHYEDMWSLVGNSHSLEHSDK